MTNFLTHVPNAHSQKWTIDMLFKNNRICKQATNFKASSPPFCVDVINVWSFIGKNVKKESDGEIKDFKD